jgi:hypothetical protein
MLLTLVRYCGAEDGVLLMCFSDLRQLLDLFVSWDWATYFADFGKTDNSKYSRYSVLVIRQ